MVAQLASFGGLALALVGAATATDAVSLRELAHSIDLPLLSGALVLAREAMPTSLAHTLEPLAAMLGLAVVTARMPLRRLAHITVPA